MKEKLEQLLQIIQELIALVDDEEEDFLISDVKNEMYKTAEGKFRLGFHGSTPGRTRK